MKSENFKRKSSEIRILKETRSVKKRINWDKIIYLTILIVSLSLLGNYLFNRYYYVSAEGQVLFETLDIQLVNDIQIRNLYIDEGDSVKRGDTLFTFIDEKFLDENGIGSYVHNSTNQNDWKRKEKMKLEEEISFKEIELARIQKLITELNSDIVRVKKEVYLDIYTVDKLDPYLKQKYDLELRLNSTRNEINILKDGIIKLNDFPDVAKFVSINSGGYGDAFERYKQAFLSPVNAAVVHIFKKEFETVLDTEHILSLHVPSDNVFIKAFFEQKDMEHLHIGDAVELEFANGIVSKGKIKRFYFDTYDLPIQFKREFKDFHRDIETEIIPFDKEEMEIWKKGQKLEVKITKRRFF